MTHSISANDLKTKGVTILKKKTAKGEEVVITIRGKSEFVVLPMDKYNFYRECELEAALVAAHKEIEEKKFIEESVDDHVKRIKRA